jgi:hypothetical protein
MPGMLCAEMHNNPTAEWVDAYRSNYTRGVDTQTLCCAMQATIQLPGMRTPTGIYANDDGYRSKQTSEQAHTYGGATRADKAHKVLEYHSQCLMGCSPHHVSND